MILAKDIIEELSINPDFNLLSSDKQIEVMNFVQQDICGRYNKARKDFYLGSPEPDSALSFFASLALAVKMQTLSASGSEVLIFRGNARLTIPAQTLSSGNPIGSLALIVPMQSMSIIGTITMVGGSSWNVPMQTIDLSGTYTEGE